MDWMNSLTWSCMICNRTRPDDKISVRNRPMAGHESLYPEVSWNVRYCNDRPGCREAGDVARPWTVFG